MFKRDNFPMGLVLGFLAPLLGMLVYRYTKFKVLAWHEFYQYVIFQPGKALLTSMVTLSLMANAILFTIYVNRKLDKTAKGIFAMTLIYVIGALVTKFINS